MLQKNVIWNTYQKAYTYTVDITVKQTIAVSVFDMWHTRNKNENIYVDGLNLTEHQLR
jgi:hypothetical protein